jgi:tRNA-splicing ligase RtcB
MGNHKLRGKDLSKLGITDDKTRSIVIDITSKHYKRSTKNEILDKIEQVITKPETYKNCNIWGKLYNEITPDTEDNNTRYFDFNNNDTSFYTCGRELISSNAWQQMNLAMKLPISVKGALMPDAHQGYGLPIGGVLATNNAVIPFGVGMDIGCMMHLSVFEESDKFITRYKHQMKTTLKDNTFFGTGVINNIIPDSCILDDERFYETSLLKRLRSKAAKQLGTSGSGNHFVEFGITKLPDDNMFNMPAGEYLSLLSHSGSRGLGADIASHYTEIAIDTCVLPKGAKHLAWLDLNSQEGQEYWIAMNLAIDFAKASHTEIHRRISKSLGIKAVKTVSSVHNLASREFIDNSSVIVHRKGATPAGKDDTGIIPGSMATPGYIVKGKGYAKALNSASHGAGRRMSRHAAKESISGSSMKSMLKANGVTLIGGSTEESPMAYKDITKVIKLQSKQVDILGEFNPKIVRMDKA